MLTKYQTSFSSLLNTKYFLLIFLIPATCFLTWALNNSTLPTADASQFLNQALTVYDHFKTEGILRGIRALYMERGWRPVIFGNFVVPFMFFSKGNLIFSSYMCTLVFQMISTFYIYFFSLLYVNRINAALIGVSAGLLTSLPFPGGFYLFSDTGLISFGLAFIYHLHRSESFKNYPQTLAATLFFALATMTRPVEGVLSLLPIILISTLKMLKEKVLTYRDFIRLFGFTTVSLLFLLLYGYAAMGSMVLHYPLHPDVNSVQVLYRATYLMIWVIANIYILYLHKDYFKRVIKNFSKNTRTSDRFYIDFIMIGVSLSVLWWLNSIPGLFEWFYMTTFGETKSPFHITPYQAIIEALNHFGIFAAAFSGLCFFSSLTLYKKSKLGAFFKSEGITYFLVAATPIILLLFITTAQSSSRKLVFSYLLFYIIGLISFFRKEELEGFKRALILLFIGLQIFSWIDFSTVNHYPKVSAKIIGLMPDTGRIKPNPYFSAMNIISDLHHKYNFKDALLISHQPQFDVFSLLSLASNKSFRLYLDLWATKPYKDSLRNSQSILLITLEDKEKEEENCLRILNYPSDYYKKGVYIIRLLNKGNLQEIGFQETECRPLKVGETIYKICLLTRM